MATQKQVSYVSFLARSTGFLDTWPKKLVEKNGQKVNMTIVDFEDWIQIHMSNDAVSRMISALQTDDLKAAQEIVDMFKRTPVRELLKEMTK